MDPVGQSNTFTVLASTALNATGLTVLKVYPGLTAVIRGHMAENDDFFTPEGAQALEKKLSDLGKDVQLTVHPGSGHAFMNPQNPLGTQDAELAARCWADATSFLHAQLG